MALRKIVLQGDDVLLKKSRDVISFDKRLHILLDDLGQTLRVAAGAGLAAPQVGVLRRVAVVDLSVGGEENAEMLELVNPVIVAAEGEQTGPEGCLSLPGRYGNVSRPLTVTVEAYDRHGKKFVREGRGIIARAFCHEIDHLDGLLFMEHVTEWVNENGEPEGL